MTGAVVGLLKNFESWLCRVALCEVISAYINLAYTVIRYVFRIWKSVCLSRDPYRLTVAYMHSASRAAALWRPIEVTLGPSLPVGRPVQVC